MAPQPIPSPQIISLFPSSPSPVLPSQNTQGEGALSHTIEGDRMGELLDALRECVD